MDAHTQFLILAAALTPLVTWLPFPKHHAPPRLRCAWLFGQALMLHLLALVALSFAATAQWTGARDVRRGGRRAVWTTRVLGSVAATYAFGLPVRCPCADPAADCLLRIATSFAACKLLDLTVARAHRPPVLLAAPRQAPRLGWRARLAYAGLLARQTRYSSFDIAVHTPRLAARRAAVRPRAPWRYLPWLAVPLHAVFRVAELQVLSALLVIELVLESLHTAFCATRCGNPLFCHPFSAPTLADFWAVHWHQCAQPFLYNLGYVPAARAAEVLGFGTRVARAAGVLAAFGLSGIWHGWCVVSFAPPEHVWAVAVGFAAVFVLQGVGCVAERAIWGRRQGSWVQRVAIWAYAVEAGAVWMRAVEARRVPIPWLDALIAP